MISQPLPPPDVFLFGLLQKQIKRVAELGGHLVLPEEREEIDLLLAKIAREISYLKQCLSVPEATN